MKKKVALIFGGRSAEHEVSIISAKNIYNAIDTATFDVQLLGISKEGTWYHFKNADVFKKYPALNDSSLTSENPITLVSISGKPVIYSLKTSEKESVDCAFPIIHGTMGEDGTLQGLFKVVQLPFVGCDVLSSAVGMDKEFMKRLMSEAGIKNSKYLILRKHNLQAYADIVKHLGSPFFIKPANAGSSVGVHKIKSEADFSTKVNDSFLYDHKVLAEEFNDGLEIECSVLGLNQKSKASLPGQLIVNHEFYSYEAKYLDANGAEIIIPARITEKQTEEIRAMAIKTFNTLGCDGLARVDFFLNKNGDILVNEINTLPGFTQISMYPKMWEATGLKYSALITELIQLAFEKFDSDKKLKLDFN
ncbi:MAG: D-alanine--D-alanine ligase family protein [Pseudobdellovibrio sp.]